MKKQQLSKVRNNSGGKKKLYFFISYEQGVHIFLGYKSYTYIVTAIYKYFFNIKFELKKRTEQKELNLIYSVLI